MEVRIRLGMMKDYPSPYEDISYEVVECKEHVETFCGGCQKKSCTFKE